VASIARHPHALTVISTHLADTASSFSGNGAIRALCLEGTIQAGAPVFDFQVRAGVSAQRLGMELLRTEGVLTLLDAIGSPDGRDVLRM
jgi:DNA mismatch repair ATPase MutS